MNRARPAILALLTLLVLSLVLTWPLPLHFATHAPGDGSDDPAILWNLWWVRYSLTELGQSPFGSAWMFWPIGINLVFYTLTTLNGLLSIPLQLAFGLVPANSFVVYFELVMGGLGMWLLARWLLARHPDAAPRSRRARDGAALLGAVVYAFSASKWLYLSLGQFNIAASHWLPWAVLYLARMWAAPTWRRGLREAALCALFALFSGWTEFTYASFFIQFAALFALWHIAASLRQGDWARAARFAALCGALGGLFLVGMAPILWLMVQDMRANGDFLVEGLGFANVFSNDALGFLVPGDQHPLLGGWVRDRLNFAYLNFAFVGWATGALALVALLARPARRYALSWATMGAAFALLSLGPTLRINGREWELPLPFDLLLQLPFFKANRYPSRYSVLVALCVGVMVAWGAAALLRREQREERREKRQVVALLSPLSSLLLTALIIAEHLGVPLPLSDYRVPEVYRELRGRAGGAVLEVPLAWRNGFRVTGTLHPSFMYAQAFQAAHEKRLLSGNTSRNPPFKFQYFTELPLVNSLLALETGHEVWPLLRTAADAALAPELLRLLDTPNLVVRRVEQAEPPVTTERALAYLETILDTTRWFDDGEYVGLEAALPPAPERYEWDALHPLARLFFAEGWSALPSLDSDGRRTANGGEPRRHGERQETAIFGQQPEARLLLPSIAAAGDWRLSFDTWLSEGAETPLTILIADPTGGAAVPLASLTVRGGEETHTVTIPASAARGSLTELRFRFGAMHPASGFVGGYAALAELDGLAFSLLVESAQEEVGKFAHIYVNGEDVATGGTGYHAALLSLEGEVLATGHFDTFNDPGAGAALVAFLEQAPPDALLALAAEDTVSHDGATGGPPLPAEVFAALQQWGASDPSDMRNRFRWSHAFIGRKGMPPGSVLEDSSPIRPARLWLGPPLHSPTVAARFDGFHLEPVP